MRLLKTTAPLVAIFCFSACVLNTGGNYSVTPDGSCTGNFVRDYRAVQKSHLAFLLNGEEGRELLRKSCADFYSVHPESECTVKTPILKGQSAAKSSDLQPQCGDAGLEVKTVSEKPGSILQGPLKDVPRLFQFTVKQGDAVSRLLSHENSKTLFAASQGKVVETKSIETKDTAIFCIMTSLEAKKTTIEAGTAASAVGVTEAVGTSSTGTLLSYQVGSTQLTIECTENGNVSLNFNKLRAAFGSMLVWSVNESEM
jgi:membrane-bound inhibitor of C-type lysozyme